MAGWCHVDEEQSVSLQTASAKGLFTDHKSILQLTTGSFLCLAIFAPILSHNPAESV